MLVAEWVNPIISESDTYDRIVIFVHSQIAKGFSCFCDCAAISPNYLYLFYDTISRRGAPREGI
jgi:hypothetical protein